MAHIATSTSSLCLLCRSNHEQTEVSGCSDCCYGSSCSSDSSLGSNASLSSSTPVRSEVFPNSNRSSLPFDHSSRHGSFSRRTGLDLRASPLCWTIILATLIAVSSAASVGNRESRTVTDKLSLSSGNRESISDNLSSEKSEADTDSSASETTAGVDKYLEEFGYYRHRHQQGSNHGTESDEANRLTEQPPQRHPTHHTEAEREEAVRRLQGFFHLPRSGHIDDETMKVVNVRRCGVKDILDDDDDDDDDDVDKDDDEEGDENIGYKNVDLEHAKAAGLVSEREVQITFPGEERKKRRRRKRYAFNKYDSGTILKWRTNQLSWQIQAYTSQLSRTEQKRAIKKALDLWATVLPIRLVEHRGQGEADIRILFARREHGDSDDPVFDGARAKPQNTLAHAWGPHPDPKGYPGDVHFDDDDDWSKPSELFIVAFHELGHSFGLLHSGDRASIMYPIYQDTTKLGLDDLEGIDFLYGPGSDKQPWGEEKLPKSREDIEGKYHILKPEWVTRRPPTGVDSCAGVTINAFLPDPSPQWKDFFLAVSGERVYRVSPRGQILRTESLDSVFPGLPPSPDIGLSALEEQVVVFIKGDTVWAYKEGAPMEGFPRSIEDMGFPEQPQFSISFQHPDGNSQPLLFGKTSWWTFDPERHSAGRQEPLSTFSRDLPDSEEIQLVLQWSDRRFYVITNDSYVTVDSIQRSKTHREPISGKPDWLSGLCEHIKTPPQEIEDEAQAAIVFFGLVVCIVVLITAIFMFFVLKKRFR